MHVHGLTCVTPLHLIPNYNKTNRKLQVKPQKHKTNYNIHHGEKKNQNQMNSNKSQHVKHPLVAVGAGIFRVERLHKEALPVYYCYLLLSSMLVHDYYCVTRHAKKYDIDI